MSPTRPSDTPDWTPEEEVEIRAAEFAWDLVIQLTKLRAARCLSQAELAERVGTKQQAISRMERPGYDRQSLRTLREVARALDAFVDVVLVPRDRAETYLAKRYQPVLEESTESVATASDLGGFHITGAGVTPPTTVLLQAHPSVLGGTVSVTPA